MRKYLALILLHLSLGSEKIYAIRDDAMSSFSAPGIGKNSEAYSNALAEATHFLALIDQEQYNSAWSDCGPIMRAIIPMQVWVEGIRYFRHPLGVVTTRETISHEHLSSLPGDITGNFYRVHFRSQFFGGRSKNETLLLSAEGLGRWRVISYNIE